MENGGAYFEIEWFGREICCTEGGGRKRGNSLLSGDEVSWTGTEELGHSGGEAGEKNTRMVGLLSK